MADYEQPAMDYEPPAEETAMPEVAEESADGVGSTTDEPDRG